MKSNIHKRRIGKSSGRAKHLHLKKRKRYAEKQFRQLSEKATKMFLQFIDFVESVHRY